MTARALYRPRKLERVEVSWTDAQHDADYDGDPDGYDAELATLGNVGYFVRLTREALVLASCIEPANGSARHFITIPRKLVREITPLSPPRTEA